MANAFFIILKTFVQLKMLFCFFDIKCLFKRQKQIKIKANFTVYFIYQEENKLKGRWENEKQNNNTINNNHVTSISIKSRYFNTSYIY